MRMMVLVVALVAGCMGGDDLKDPAVAACHARADRTCEAVGFPGDSFCELVMRQGCSERDAAVARAMCEAHPEMLAERRAGECVPEWR